MSQANNKNRNTDENPYQPVVNQLADNVLHLFEPCIKLIQTQLNELNQQGQILLQQIQNENSHLSQIQHSTELYEIFNLIETYEMKLINIKKDMKAIHERSKKLKKRAIKLQQFKEKTDYFIQQKESEVKMEENLVGKLAK